MTTETFDRFYRVTKIDIQQFITDLVNYYDNYYQNIIDYYTSNGILNSNTISKLSDLKIKRDNIKDAFNVYSERLSDFVDMWELLDSFEDMSTKIDTISNSQKWFRSNKGFSFDNQIESDIVLNQGQNLQDMADELGYTNPLDDWVNIALKNRLKEEDYDETGGNKLKVTFQNNAQYGINSVLDSISGEKIYGKDICRQFQFLNNDILILEYKDTLNQTIEILTNTYKGSVPEFPDDGIDKSIVGGNLVTVQSPVIFKQISKIIGKDDSFKSVTLSKVSDIQDMKFIEIQIQTKIGDKQPQTIAL
jgi:hypothetical protein